MSRLFISVEVLGNPPKKSEPLKLAKKRIASDSHSRWTNMSRALIPDNGNVHRAAAKDLQAEKTARPAAPCATYCYRALCETSIAVCLVSVRAFVPDQEIVHYLAGQIKAILDEYVPSLSSALIIAKQIVFVM